MEEEYKTDFEKFLAHTDEKEVLLNETIKEIRKINADSLLDIGAGDGSLAIPLSKGIKKYVAVESKQKFVSKLKSEGLSVIEGVFPLNINERFDIVFSSHALSYKPEIYADYIDKALELLKQGGLFIIITFRGQEDDWTALLKELGIPQMDYHRVGFNQIIQLLHKHTGSVTTRKVTTTVNTLSIDDIVDVLSFVYHGGNSEQKNKFTTTKNRLIKILNSRYKKSHGYSFPFQHTFIITKKN